MTVKAEPFFLNSSEGRRLFCMSYNNVRVRGELNSVLLLPAFAEEMNCTRRLTHAISCGLAELGYRVLTPDLSNTGDSTGRFVDARFANWLDDVKQCSQWLMNDAATISLLTFRAGSLFLPQLTQHLQNVLKKVCLIQPLDSGGQWLTEFLRIRVAKSMFEGETENIESLKRALTSGHNVEVAGYELSTELFNELMELSLTNERICISEQGLVITSKRSIDESREEKVKSTIRTWNCSGESFRSTLVRGDAFWSSDQSLYPDNIKETVLAYFK